MSDTRSRFGSLMAYLRRLMASGYSGRIQIALDFNRGGISNMAAFKIEKDTDL